MSEVVQMKQMDLDELRLMLSDEMRRLRDGDTSAAVVNALSNASGKFLSSIKLELDIYKMIGKPPDGVSGLLPDRGQKAKAKSKAKAA